jgi:hypothetical protein
MAVDIKTAPENNEQLQGELKTARKLQRRHLKSRAIV